MRGDADWGRCVLTATLSAKAEHPQSLALAQDAESYYAALDTHRDFGCVQYQAGVYQEPVPVFKATPRARFLRATVHPDYGRVEAGEVLTVTKAYLRDYVEAGIAEATDEPASRPDGKEETQT
jgi:hypothetical protein